MKAHEYIVLEYDAEDGKVFDFKNAEENNHLYAKQIFLGDGDSIDNYIEIDESEMIIPPEEEELDGSISQE